MVDYSFNVYATSRSNYSVLANHFLEKETLKS